MSNLLLIAVCLGLGVALRRVPAFPADTGKALGAWVLYVALPALVLAKLRSVRFGAEVWLPASMAWLQLLVVAGVVTVAGRRFGWGRDVRAALLLTAGVANTSFVGWPLVEASFGAEGLPTAILADQLGSFVVVATAGTAIAGWGSGRPAGPRDALLRLVRFPAVFAMALAFLLRDVAVPAPVTEVLERLGGTLTPLALVSVGFQLRGGASGDPAPLVVGLATKLLVVPAVLLGFYLAVGVSPGLPLRVTVLEAAMPPMITGAILANEHGLAPALANRMVGVGIPLGLFTVWGWAELLRHFA